jgi:RNA polymerase sigma-70 factor (ECF subfamily)
MEGVAGEIVEAAAQATMRTGIWFPAWWRVAAFESYTPPSGPHARPGVASVPQCNRAAEDLLQETFVRAWVNSCSGESLFGTWLLRLAVNVALSDQRIRVRGANLVSLDETAERVLWVSVMYIPRITVTGKRHRNCRNARTVLVLFDIEGYGHAEIADITGMAEGSSKAQLHRARKLLRKELEA